MDTTSFPPQKPQLIKKRRKKKTEAKKKTSFITFQVPTRGRRGINDGAKKKKKHVTCHMVEHKTKPRTHTYDMRVLPRSSALYPPRFPVSLANSGGVERCLMLMTSVDQPSVYSNEMIKKTRIYKQYRHKIPYPHFTQARNQKEIRQRYTHIPFYRQPRPPPPIPSSAPFSPPTISRLLHCCTHAL